MIGQRRGPGCLPVDFLKAKVEAYRLNCAIDGKAGGYEVDAGFRREVENFHSEDVALYKRALQDRELRI